VLDPGNRSQQDRVHDAEERGVGADAYCQREKDDADKAGLPGVAAQRQPQILKQVVHETLP
jgi:hypothetical protein